MLWLQLPAVQGSGFMSADCSGLAVFLAGVEHLGVFLLIMFYV